jgi:hypothetical protein
MNWLSGSVTVRRFAVDGPRPRFFGGEHLDRLRAHAAGTQRIASADGVETGWTGGESILDTTFTEGKNVWPDHLLFDLWTQTDRLPADLLKAYYVADLAALSRNNPSGYPSSRQKREARESAKDRLWEQAKDGRFLKRKIDPILWDAGRNEVYFGTTSDNAAARLCSLFGQTFGSDLTQVDLMARGLTPISAGTLAVSRHPEAKSERLSEFVRGVTPDEPKWSVDPDVPDFLGSEFLIWLWHIAEQDSDTLECPDGSEATFLFSGGVRLGCPRGQGDDVINSDSGIRTPEARAGLTVGKIPTKAALTVVRHADQFSFKIVAESLAITAAKLPAPPDDATGRARDEHRLQAVRDLVETVEQMYFAFLDKRLGPQWQDELRRIQHWIAGRKAVA